jgi:hypothetical protein
VFEKKKKRKRREKPKKVVHIEEYLVRSSKFFSSNVVPSSFTLDIGLVASAIRSSDPKDSLHRSIKYCSVWKDVEEVK